jgi:hypothetical protein
VAFIVEDGTVVVGANSYVSLEYAATYLAARGYTLWADMASPGDAQESALIIATSYIDTVYRFRFPGTRKMGRGQRLEWPRADAEDIYGDVIADDVIPTELMDAVCEAAIRQLTTPGSLLPDYVASEKVISEKVGDLSVTYSDKAVSSGLESVIPVISVIDGILEPILTAQVSFIFGSTTRSN